MDIPLFSRLSTENTPPSMKGIEKGKKLLEYGSDEKIYRSS
jgi:hypothetical protein